MNWKKTIGFGALIWVIMFAVVSALIGFKVFDLSWAKIVTVLAAGISSYIFAGYARPENSSRALMFGISWVLTGFILDWFISLKFNSLLFYSRTLWAGYVLIFLAPLLRRRKN